MRRLAPLTVLFLAGFLPAAEETPSAARPTLALDVGGHTGLIQSAFFTANDTRLITVAYDRTIRTWDVETGHALEVIHLPPIDRSDIGLRINAALAPDGNLLAVSLRTLSASTDWIYLIDMSRRQITRILQRSGPAIHSLTWTPQGKEVAAGTEGSIELWDPLTGKECRSLSVASEDGESLEAIAFSPKGDRVASRSNLGTLRVWDWPGGKLLRRTEYDRRLVATGGRSWSFLPGLTWSTDGKTFAGIEGNLRLVRLWSRDGVEQQTLPSAYVSLGIEFSPTSSEYLLAGSHLLRHSTSGGWKIWRRLKFDEVPVDEMAALVEGIRIAVTLGKSGIAAWTSGSKALLWDTNAEPEGPGPGVNARSILGARSHIVHRVGWSNTGSTLVWSYNKAAPERAFDLGELAYRVPSANSFVEQRQTLGKRSLVLEGVRDVAVREGETRLTTVRLIGMGPQRTTSFLDNARFVLAGGSGCWLYSSTTGKVLERYTGSDYTRAVSTRSDGKYFVTGGDTQTLQVYTPGRKTPLLSFYPAGKEWIAWTPEGYYAASPGGERLMGWLVQEAPDQLPTFHPAARFRKVFYRPDVIRELLKAGSVEKALAALSKGMEKPVALEKVLPPRVRILTPEKRTEVRKSKVQVKASAQGTTDHPVQSLQLVVDGRPYEPHRGTRGFRSVEKPTPGERLETWDVTLQPGRHEIRVVAKNALTTAVSDPVEITYTPEEKVSSADDLRQALHVLAIGVDDYPGDLQLKCAVNDATKIAQTLGKHSKSLFPRGVFLHLRTNKQADKQGILRAFDDLAKQARPHDVVVVFFAGHGHVEKADGKFYLLPHGVDIDAMEKTAVSETEFKAKLSAVPGQVVLMMDACHSGATKQKGLWKRRATSVTDGVQRSFADEEVGVVVWLAAMGNEYAEEKEGHGLFTRAMMEGLAGAAGKNRKGEVHLASLDAYVFEKVTDWSEGKQRPNCARPPSVYPFSLSKPTKE